jgi:hypothetical protein
MFTTTNSGGCSMPRSRNPFGGAASCCLLLLALLGPSIAAAQDQTDTGSRLVVPSDAWGARDQAGDRYAVASIKTIDPAYAWWSNAVTITLGERHGVVTVVGIRRPDGATNPVRNAAK